MKLATSGRTVHWGTVVRSGAPEGSLKDLWIAGARDWRLSTQVTAFLSLGLPLSVCVLGIATALVGKQAYKAFTREDGIAEDLQVLCWGLALLLSVVVMRRLWKSGARAFVPMYLLLGLGIAFILGEELSWGQRIFGWHTSAALSEVNRQGETNLHNINGVEERIRWFHFLVGAYGTLLPLLLYRAQRGARFNDPASLLVPHYTLVPYFFATLAWRVQAILWEPPRQLHFVINEYSEVMELVLAIGFLLFLLFQVRKSRTPAGRILGPVTRLGRSSRH
ncbi:MAG TPA: hypothetical protein VGK93_12325 [Candidatus Eisenbacteria bacterium]|jgi:hypothetical protein